MIKKQYLLSFVDRLNNYQIIRNQPFLTLYDHWFLDARKDLENEIYENMLSQTDKTTYLEYVKKRVREDVEYQNDSQFLDKWVKKYDLYDLKFPFTENEEIEQIIGTSINQSDLSYEQNKLCTNMQIDFYCHAAMVEKYKMIDFIDELVELEIKNKQPAVPGEKKKDYDFRNHIWFKAGVLFAKGEMNEYYYSNKSGFKDGYSAPSVTKKIGHENYEKYILGTINNYSLDNRNADKNVFNSRDRMIKIIDYCEENEISVIPYFIKRLPPE